ncbi:hypothetical protein CRG98_008810 [Punica granatum]|uniref:Uncharacterized protein n=1 Tax=Punica granatum TaxID=22663 RepID=A0A2I0KR46_PUNGR|nr:hypothetical protein CRG98_008810 [Punica granatum]
MSVPDVPGCCPKITAKPPTSLIDLQRSSMVPKVHRCASYQANVTKVNRTSSLETKVEKLPDPCSEVRNRGEDGTKSFGDKRQSSRESSFIAYIFLHQELEPPYGYLGFQPRATSILKLLNPALSRHHFVEDVSSAIQSRVLVPFFPIAPPTEVEEIHPLGLESIYLTKDSPSWANWVLVTQKFWPQDFDRWRGCVTLLEGLPVLGEPIDPNHSLELKIEKELEFGKGKFPQHDSLKHSHQRREENR